MKKQYRNLLLAGGALLALASCSENSWNDMYLDGFESGYTATDVRTVEYTLVESDYARIADNRFNVALAAKNGVSDALKTVKTQRYLNSDIPAADYIPNLLKDSLFTYFTLSDGSAINLTYRQAGEISATMKALNGAREYTVSEDDYQMVYGSTEDYANSFAPSYSASSNLPKVLAASIDDAEEGEYVLVNYNTSNTDPIFGNVPETPAFELSSVLNSELQSGDDVTINGVVTAVSTAGVIVTDNTGSILVYSKEFPHSNFKVGDQVIATGTLAYYKNCLQLPYSDNVEIVGSQSYTYPEAIDFTPEALLAGGANTAPVLAQYGKMTGRLVIDGNFYNVYFPNGEGGERIDVRGSLYNVTDALKAQMQNDAEFTFYGYFTQTSTFDTYTNCNFVVTDVKAATKQSRRHAATRSVVIPSENVYAVYLFEGGKWKEAGKDIVAVNPSDYTAMGLSYTNFSGSQASTYLPTFLKNKYPYAQADAVKYVVYRYYASSTTSVACTEYKFNGAEWTDTSDGIETVTNQFVRRNGEWKLDPSIEITLPAGKNQPLSTWFYQACVDWIGANVANGSEFITSYGNNEYYCGTSAYQGNIDLRPGSAKTQSASYDGMTDEEIVALMKERFEKEVCPGVLTVLYPNLAPVGDFEPTVTIHFYSYNGSSTTPGTIVLKCVDKAKYEFVSCNWDESN